MIISVTVNGGWCFQDTVTVHTKIRPKDVPGTLLNVVCTPLFILVHRLCCIILYCKEAHSFLVGTGFEASESCRNSMAYFFHSSAQESISS